MKFTCDDRTINFIATDKDLKQLAKISKNIYILVKPLSDLIKEAKDLIKEDKK